MRPSFHRARHLLSGRPPALWTTSGARFRHLARVIVLGCALGAAFPWPASGQTVEIVGVRALGMGGAFVAVADDATGMYWNPAGLANGPLFDASAQRTMTSAPVSQANAPAAGGGWRASTTFVGFALPSLGVSYLRQRIQQAISPTAASADGRQQDRPGVAPVSSLATDQVGVTLLQSLFPRLVVGTTLKVVRGSYAASASSAASLLAAFDEAAQLPASAVTRFDLDVGVLAFAGPVRVGFVGRNIRQPDFAPDDASGAGRVHDQLRVGFALTPGFVINRTAAALPPTTIAVDADLTRSTVMGAEERHVAAGLEHWLAGRSVGIRAGVRANTVGDLRPMATAGGSVAIRRGLLLEGQYARGDHQTGQQWTVAGRMLF